MDAPFDAQVVRDLLWVWHARHEGLRTTAVEASDSPGRLTRSTCAGSDVDIVHERVSDVFTSAELNDRLNAELESRLSPLRWPHCLAATIEHRDTGNFTLLVGADHSVMDAYSQVLIVTELRALYRALLDGAALYGSDVYGSAADYALLEREAAAALTAESPPVALWREFLDAADRMFPRFQPSVPHVDEVGGPPQTSVSRWLLTDAEATAIDAAVTALGYRATTAVFAALALASNRLSGAADFRTIMPMATRPDARWSESVGWFVNIVPVWIPVNGDADLSTALAATDTALRRARSATTAPAQRILEILEVADEPRFAVSFVDIRRLHDDELITALRGRALRSHSYSSEEVYFWIVRAAKGINISARFPPACRAIAHRFIEEFTAILRACGTEISPTGDAAVLSATNTGAA
ncbi:condensation domain-containing protein [Nocardia terpenica]|nr:condensation domain-containing protein [Nocardia terpenica]